MRKVFQIILDTSVIVSAIRSKRGASYKLLLQLAADACWQINLSTALLLEYEAKAQEHAAMFGYTNEQVDDFLDFLCSAANEHQIYFRWRPFLPDAGDEFVLELAIAAGADYIVTYNKKDFVGAGAFGIEIITPFEFLQILGEIK
ncbi:MAG: putative toxin-antitoxin system toxin component, PIN family [Pyrinomonadaceae bacterium]|nr:putative toxin-antitoxin system toxin component, PIN family [Pyrinomonadaceae bacterium]